MGQAFRNLYGKTTDSVESILKVQLLKSTESTAFIENHDKERDPEGDANFALSRVNQAWWYKQAIAFNILYPWGLPIVHSGYAFSYRGGEPNRETPVSAPYDTNGYILPIGQIVNNSCPAPFMCQHRWSDVFPLTRVRNYIKDANIPTIQTNGRGSNQIYWSIPNKAFVAINSAQGLQQNQDMFMTVNTGLPSGTYCNMVYGYAVNGKCVLWPGLVLKNQELVYYTVDANGQTQLKIKSGDKSRVVALYSAPDGIL